MPNLPSLLVGTHDPKPFSEDKQSGGYLGYLFGEVSVLNLHPSDRDPSHSVYIWSSSGLAAASNTIFMVNMLK